MIDVVVITSGDLARLQVCFAALVSNSVQSPEMQMIIVVDTHDDHCIRYARHMPGAVRARIVQGPMKGRSAARNFGASQGTASWIAFLDGDMLVERDWLIRLCGDPDVRPALRRGKIVELIATPTVATLCRGGRGFPALDPGRLAREGFDPSGYRTMRSLLETAVECRELSGDEDMPAWLASSGANFAIPRAVWSQLGGQDEQFGRRWGCEDLEFSHRCLRAGVAIDYVRAAPAYHLSHPQPSRWSDHRASLALFAELSGDPDVLLLERLLGPNGSIAAYKAGRSGMID
ncbi:glycosyltransferase [Sphingomonas sp. DG1-23]|uniref:glycosyltransferase family 2 protein n=1 Tax=Sphingomonas sp. DG1-23 TaxID=3068316 RepID=UPI00273F8980|nr:glycosyltransferase [Sphingomonas sp. DG1-23]MDP5278675.1 glycosyltransferase [Sphingomonas sp. DG1-23]